MFGFGVSEFTILLVIVVVFFALIARDKRRASKVTAQEQARAVSPNVGDELRLQCSIFISYRRGDSAEAVDRISDHLVEHFGRSSIFRDVDSVPLGVDFRKHVNEVVDRCDVVLAVIGRNWLSAQDDAGNPRLSNPQDYVRIELESALQRDIPVIPLLVAGASIVAAGDLPDSLAALAYRNGIPIRPDPDFRNDIGRLISGIEQLLSSNRP